MNCSDENIMALLLSQGAKPEEQALRCLKNCANPAHGVLLRLGLREEDERRSFFHLAVAEFIVKARQRQFVLTGAARICTYIVEVARRKWLETSRKMRTVTPELPAEEADTPDGRVDELQEALQKLTPSDREILVAFYFYEVPLTDYANQNGLSHDAAKRRISRARERLKAFIQTNAP